ncbi:hypothetical protein AKO1_013251 [Acrasis kona]|uniref:Uncharacterized protein n=1 Tax=Acrasis kona TaxID=1008807 RepID=A0AAW2YZ29_9EUKA
MEQPFIHKTLESSYYYISLKIEARKDANPKTFDAEYIHTILKHMLTYFYGLAGGNFLFEVLSYNGDTSTAMVVLERRFVIMFRAMLCFNFVNEACSKQIELFRVIKVSPYLHAHEHSSQLFFSKYFTIGGLANSSEQDVLMNE